MKRIPNINITQREYENFQKNFCQRGGEGIICHKDDTSLYKLFIDPKGNASPMPENKQVKILSLYQKKLLYSVKPLSTISYQGEIVGYQMTYNPHDCPLENIALLDRKTLIKILKKSKNILEYFASKDITYGDVTADNILVNIKTGEITFCDIDNMRVGTHKIDTIGSVLARYYEKNGIIDAKADAYMHNLLTIKKLSCPYQYESEIIKDLRREIYPKKFKQHAQQVFQSMTKPEKFNGEYVIKYVKR